MKIQKANPICDFEILSIDLQRPITAEDIIGCVTDDNLIAWQLKDGSVVMATEQYHQYLDDFLAALND